MPFCAHPLAIILNKPYIAGFTHISSGAHSRNRKWQARGPRSLMIFKLEPGIHLCSVIGSIHVRQLDSISTVL